MNKADVDAESRSEHCQDCTTELGRPGKRSVPLLPKVDNFDEKNDVLPVELHARRVDLEAIIVRGQAVLEGLHGVHLAALRVCRSCHE